MKSKTLFRAASFGGAILWVSVSAGAQNTEKFKARLTPVPIELATMNNITGSGSATAVLTGTTLSVTGTFAGLRTPATIAHLHNGPKGIRGPAVFDLQVSKATSGTINGTLQLTRAQVEDLRKSKLYLQIHSEKAPDGNLWGWLLP